MTYSERHRLNKSGQKRVTYDIAVEAGCYITSKMLTKQKTNVICDFLNNNQNFFSHVILLK